MATTLAPVENREVVRCDHCHLVQFRTVNNLCRKCRTSLDEDEPEPILAQPIPVREPESSSRSEVQVAIAIRNLRQRSGLSQRQLALRMGVPRTYVSKIENEKATPTLSSLSRLAEALLVSMPELLSACTPSRENEINELLDVSADGRKAAAVYTSAQRFLDVNHVILWDVAKGTALVDFQQPGIIIQAGAFVGDRYLFAAAKANELILWSLR